MIALITFYPILGLPLIAWGGMFTFLCLIITASIAYLTVNNIKPLPVNWHYKMAWLTIILSVLHGLAAILSFIKI
jgi:cytochrome b561